MSICCTNWNWAGHTPRLSVICNGNIVHLLRGEYNNTSKCNSTKSAMSLIYFEVDNCNSTLAIV